MKTIKKYTYKSIKSYDQIRSLLTDLSIYAKFHPLIDSATLTDQPGTFDITERPFRWMPFKISYQCVVEEKGQQIEYRISGLPASNATLLYIIDSSDGHHKIDLHLQIKNTLGLNYLLQYFMGNAQDKLWANFNMSGN